MTPKILPEHRQDVLRYGRAAFLDVDRSTRLYAQLGRPGGDWARWEWPRRLAALEHRPIVDVPVQLMLDTEIL